MKRKDVMIVQRLIQLLAPAGCLGCERQGDLLCRVCISKVSPWSGQNLILGDLDGVVIAAKYEGVVKSLVLRLKFERSRSAAKLAARLIMRTELPEFDVVTSVPVAPARYRERGYNQAELIARALARQIGLPYRSVLARTTATHQMHSSRSERLAQIRGVFYPIRRLNGERVL